MTDPSKHILKGLNDGPVKTYLFREYPETMKNAISLAIQEDFSLNQAYLHSASRPRNRGAFKQIDTSEPMDLSFAETKSFRGKKDGIRCHRCQHMGHFAHECMAPKPVPRQQRQRNGSSTNRPKNGRVEPSKNGQGQ